MTSTFERLRAILVKDYQLAPDRLSLAALLADLGIDSLGVAELLFNIEDEFKITLPPEAVALTTLGDVVAYIDALFTAQHGSQAPAVGGLPGAAGAPQGNVAPPLSLIPMGDGRPQPGLRHT